MLKDKFPRIYQYFFKTYNVYVNHRFNKNMKVIYVQSYCEQIVYQ